MKDSTWFKRLEIALEFDAGLEIFLLLGPGDLAVTMLDRVARELRRFGEPRWHNLQFDGFDGLVAGPDRGKLHLVHGFERMGRPRAAHSSALLNVHRDRLRSLDAPILFWIPEDFYDDFSVQAPDLLAWRSQVSVIPPGEFDTWIWVAEVHAHKGAAQLASGNTWNALCALAEALKQLRKCMNFGAKDDRVHLALRNIILTLESITHDAVTPKPPRRDLMWVYSLALPLTDSHPSGPELRASLEKKLRELAG